MDVPPKGQSINYFVSRGEGGQKLLILHGKKTTKRWGGCKKLLILRRHSSWTAPKWSNLMIMFLFWLVPVCSSHNRCPCSFLSMTGYFKGLCQDWLWTNGLIYWGHPRCTWLGHHGLLYHMDRKVVQTITSVRRPNMKRDAGVKCCLFIVKRQHFTSASIFIFGRQTDVMALSLFLTVEA